MNKKVVKTIEQGCAVLPNIYTVTRNGKVKINHVNRIKREFLRQDRKSYTINQKIELVKSITMTYAVTLVTQIQALKEQQEKEQQMEENDVKNLDNDLEVITEEQDKELKEKLKFNEVDNTLKDMKVS